MSERKIDFSNYKVGDKVWSMEKQGWVEIIEKGRDDEDWRFKLSDGYWITKHGARQITGKPLYFPNEFEIPDQAYRKPIPQIAVDTPIWVRQSDTDSWLPRHFAGWFRGQALVWIKGKTSHTARNRAYPFLHYSLTNPENDG